MSNSRLFALALFAAANAIACTNITDTLTNLDESPWTGRIVAQLGYSTLSGSGQAMVPQNATRLNITTVNAGAVTTCLTPGYYQVTYAPTNYPNYLRWWNVPNVGTPVTIRAIEAAAPGVLFNPLAATIPISVPITPAMSSIGITPAQHGCGATPIWRVWDVANGWTGTDATLDAFGNLTLTWSGSFAGYVRVSCGDFAPNFSAPFDTTVSTLVLAAANTGMQSASVLLQCYDSGGNFFAVDYSVDSAFNVSAAVNPAGVTAITGSCILGAIN